MAFWNNNPSALKAPDQFELVEASVYNSEGVAGQSSFTLDDKGSSSERFGSAQSVKNITGTQSGRIDKEELEFCYITDEIVFNSVNKYMQVLMSSKISIVGKDEVAVNYIKAFSEEIGNSGDLITWRDLLELIGKSLLIYGWSPIENVYSDDGREIIDCR